VCLSWILCVRAVLCVVCVSLFVWSFEGCVCRMCECGCVFVWCILFMLGVLVCECMSLVLVCVCEC